MKLYKNNEISDSISIKTIGELKAYIENLPNDMLIYLWDVGIGGTVYDVSIQARKQECIEHNGKKWVAEGLMIETDT